MKNYAAVGSAILILRRYADGTSWAEPSGVTNNAWLLNLCDHVDGLGSTPPGNYPDLKTAKQAAALVRADLDG